jgi:gliding motility-associated-like protein
MLPKKLITVFLFTSMRFMAQSIGGTVSGAQTYCDTLNSGFVSVSGYSGTIVTWQYSVNGGVSWTNNGNTFASQSYFNLKQSTCYRAVVKNGSAPADTSTIACITIYLPSVGGTISGGGSFCGSSGPGILTLTGNTGNVTGWETSTNNGASWTSITNTTTSLPYPNLTQNTLYRAIVQNSSFCLKDTSAIAGFTINPNTVAGTITTAGTTTLCYAPNASTLNLTGNTGNVLHWISSTDNGTNWSSVPNTSGTLPVFNLTQTQVFAAVVQNANCAIDTTNRLTLQVLPQNTVSAGTDTTISAGQSVTLNGSGTGTPLWTPVTGLDNPGILNPLANPGSSTAYILTLTDVNSCVVSDTVLVTVLTSKFEGIVTTVFSPNGDGINDRWFIENIHFYPENEVTVYNIYGNIVYNQKGYKNDWQGTYNGSPLPDGTYFYVIKIDKEHQLLKGSLDILRSK